MKTLLKWAALSFVIALLWKGVPKDQSEVSEFLLTVACLFSFCLLGFILGASSRLAVYKIEKMIGPGSLYSGLSIVGIIVRRTQRATNWQMVALFLLLLATVADFLVHRAWNLSLLWLWLTVSLLCYARLRLLEFRVGMGYYGGNENEAREIISFIINETEDIDLSGGGKGREILSAEDLGRIEYGLQMPAIDGEPA